MFNENEGTGIRNWKLPLNLQRRARLRFVIWYCSMCFCDVTMMLLRRQSILYFNVKRTIWLKGYQNGKHIEPSEQRLQEISIAKNW